MTAEKRSPGYSVADKYRGATARVYETRRVGGRKWQREQQAAERMLRAIRPASVLDAPIGTGRFVPVYREIGAEYVGVDISPDMLAQAATRGDGELLAGDFLTLAPWRRFDCVVCVRFMNWLPSIDVMFERIAAYRPQHVVISITTTQWWAFARSNGATVHPESTVRALLLRLGYVEHSAERWPIDSNRTASMRWLMRKSTPD